MFSSLDEPRRNPFAVIVQRRIDEHEWWQARCTEAQELYRTTDTEVDRRLVGIVQATRDKFTSDASTIDYLDTTARMERRTMRAIRRIKRRRRLRRVGTFIIRCLECLGASRPPVTPGSAPR